MLAPDIQPSQAQQITTVQRYDTLELTFTSQSVPANPFDTYLLRLEITDPSGRVFTIDGFYDGDGNGGQTGNVWKARITPYLSGRWTWRTVPGDGGVVDPQFNGLTGEFDALDNNNPGAITSEGRYFRWQNGGYAYLVGNFLDFANGLRTTHTFMSETTTDGQRDAIIQRQRDFHNVNKANIYIANRGDYSAQSVTPWVGDASNNDKSRMDLARWRRYDSYVRRFQNEGILAELWYFADDSNFGALSAADVNRLTRYTMARLSPFSHTLFVIALEWQEGFSANQITAAGEFIQQHNPWGRLLSVHSLTGTGWGFSGQPWGTFIATQAGNDAGPALVNRYAREMNQREAIPHMDEEFGILESNSNSRLRANLWANFLGGAAGSGTGSDLRAFRHFLNQSGVPFQRMQAANDLVEDGGNSRFVLAEPNHHYVVYSGSGSFSLSVNGSQLVGRWFNPRDPNANLGEAFAVTSGVNTFSPPSESNQDWVLWITEGTASNPTATPIPTETMLPATATPIPTETVLPATVTPVSTNMPTPVLQPIGPTVAIEITPHGMNVGDSIDVAFRLVNVMDLYGLQTECTVSPGSLVASGFAEGDLFNSSNSLLVGNRAEAFNASTGQWLAAATRTSPNPAITGDGIAYTLRYSIQTASNIAFNCSAFGVNANGVRMPLAVVSTSSVPELVATPEATAVSPETQTPVPTLAYTETPPPAAAQEVVIPTSTVMMAGTLSGLAVYQNRPDNAGITVELFDESQKMVAQTVTSVEGAYSFNMVTSGTYALRYMAQQHVTLVQVVVVETDEQSLDLGQVILRAGDVNDDGIVDLVDASFVGANYGQDVMPEIAYVDLNGDGLINVGDLAMVGGNYGITGPLILGG
ncbi:MAG: DUF5060 domain-containing protein [Anaerolineae bacterium]|nr:DUF5060 domain-containing protein [Anaerolineae bacterium]